MKDKKLLFILIAAAIIAAVSLAGCTSPTPTPTAAPSPTVPPAISPAPTQAVINDRATVDFSYIQREYTQSYEGIPAFPGEIIYAFDVTVDSDKPVQTDASWFSVEYRQNATGEIKTYPVMTNVNYPSTTIGNGSGPATGRLLFVLQAPGDGAIGPNIVYFKPMDEQKGPYKVYDKVYGFIRTT